jgi:hypothetical protein
MLQFPRKGKESFEFEHGNITPPDGMKSYDAVGPAISV